MQYFVVVDFVYCLRYSFGIVLVVVVVIAIVFVAVNDADKLDYSDVLS